METDFSDAKASLKLLDSEKNVSGTSKMKKQAFLSKAQERSAFALEGRHDFSDARYILTFWMWN
jgi:hypothetical protein